MSTERSELVHTLQELRRLGYSEAAFVFAPTRYANIGAGLAPIFADMLVENSVNGRKKTYAAAHGSAWPAEFSDDLRRGVFGGPRMSRS